MYKPWIRAVTAVHSVNGTVPHVVIACMVAPPRGMLNCVSAKVAETDEHPQAMETQSSSWLLNPVVHGIYMVAFSVIGLLASFDLSIEKVKKLENPEYILSCDMNPFFSCSGVMQYPQSQLFGFPNQFLGIAAFVFPLLLGVLLISRAQIPGWVMVGLNIGLLGGVALVTFLYISSIWVIGIGCPWCIVVWTVTIPLFCTTTGYNALVGNFGTRIRDNVTVRVFASSSLLISVVLVFVIYVSIVIRFWDYFSTLF